MRRRTILGTTVSAQARGVKWMDQFQQHDSPPTETSPLGGSWYLTDHQMWCVVTNGHYRTSKLKKNASS